MSLSKKICFEILLAGILLTFSIFGLPERVQAAVDAPPGTPQPVIDSCNNPPSAGGLNGVNAPYFGWSRTLTPPSSTVPAYSCIIVDFAGNDSTYYFDVNGQPTQVNGVYAKLPSATDPSGYKTYAAPSGCGLTDFEFNKCIWIPLLKSIGSWFLTIGGALLRLAGMLFDLLVLHVIVQFGTTLNDLHINDGIDIGWTIFRDVANILIIGIFVFIAISIILGLKEFGQKKLVATVIIIAVLINFSLLFTKMIIDFSNFTALQFYNATAKANPDPSTNGPFDVARAFLLPVGITSVWDSTRPLIDSVANAQQGKGDEPMTAALKAFAFGFVGGLMLLILAIILFYGSFLIASRAVLLIVLMITASIAFATHLVPKLSDGEYGWSTWWKSLINVSIFAPLLMVFIFISLAILKTAGGYRSGTLGTIAGGDPSTALSSDIWKTLIIYVLATGLLYASLKISHKFANSISGMGILGGGIGAALKMAAAPIALGSRFIAAPALKYTAGLAASTRAATLSGRAKNLEISSGLAYNEAGAARGLAAQAASKRREAVQQATDARARVRAAQQSGNVTEYNTQRSVLQEKMAAVKRLRAEEQRQQGAAEKKTVEGERLAAGVPSLVRRATTMKKVAASKMNVMNTEPAKAVTKAIGLKGVFTGQSAKTSAGYSGIIDARAKAAEKVAMKMAPTRDDNDKIRMEAERRMTIERADRSKQLNQAATIAREEAARQKAIHEEDSRTAAAAQAHQTEAQAARDKKLIEEARSRNVGSNDDHAALSDTTKRDNAGNEWKEELKKALSSVEPAKRADLETKMGTATSANELKTIQDELKQAIADPTLRETVKNQLNQSAAARESEMRKQEDRINGARDRILNVAKVDTDIQKAVEPEQRELDTQNATLAAAQEKVAISYPSRQKAETEAARLDGEAKRFDAATGNEIKKAGENAVQALRLSAETVAKEIGRQYGNIFQRVGGAITGINEKVGKEVHSRYRAQNTRIARLNRDLRQYQLDETPPEPPAPTPPTT